MENSTGVREDTYGVFKKKKKSQVGELCQADLSRSSELNRALGLQVLGLGQES